jgi:hypothetical protein
VQVVGAVVAGPGCRLAALLVLEELGVKESPSITVVCAGVLGERVDHSPPVWKLDLDVSPTTSR